MTSNSFWLFSTLNQLRLFRSQSWLGHYSLLFLFDSYVGTTLCSLVSQFLMQGYCGTFLVRGGSQHVQHLIMNHVHMIYSAMEHTYSIVCRLDSKLNSQLFHPSCCEDVVRFTVFCFSLIHDHMHLVNTNYTVLMNNLSK